MKKKRNVSTVRYYNNFIIGMNILYEIAESDTKLLNPYNDAIRAVEKIYNRAINDPAALEALRSLATRAVLAAGIAADTRINEEEEPEQ